MFDFLFPTKSTKPMAPESLSGSVGGGAATVSAPDGGSDDPVIIY
jgi:hypothetical protein